MRFSKSALALILCLAPVCVASDQIPGKPQSTPIAIVGATIHPVSGPTLLNGTIVFDQGRIVQVEQNAALPEGTVVVDGQGKHVYPSLIDANSDIGLVEINSVRETLDATETGSINPNVRARVAFNADSELIPVNRANGVLLAVTAPRGGLVSGRASLMMLDGWTWEDMTLEPETGMHVNWPGGESDVKKLVELLAQARRYQAARAAGDEQQPRDFRLEAMQPVIEQTLPLVVSASRLEDIEAAVAFARQNQVRLVISGGYDAASCADLLKRENVPVIISAVYRLPSRRHAAYDEGYTLPMRLEAAGVQYCISAGGKFGASGLRNLPYNAATAAAYGLTPEQALRAITLSPAQILGVSDRVGSLQVGMDATLFLADGDILETATQVEAAYVRGRAVDLDNKHKQLYRKYSSKIEAAE